MRNIIILVAVLLIGLGAWLLLRGDGVVEEVTEARVAEALLDNGVPPAMTQCMAPRLVDRLSIAQLQKLERLAPRANEGAVPTNLDEALDRMRRVGDDQAVEQLVLVSGRCGIEVGRGLLGL
ncbi:hypothetical protein [Erythrobacter sp.]|jgi:hypothetical protein|uniref:hypothetical protein n=1 Tax=Erythrobacter sp. TaxID=1042 RepID=UPI002EA5884B|nr:hypothetical protein [Erythrobacter sp.]